MGGSSPTVYGAEVAGPQEPESVLLPGHDVPLGRYTSVRRLLPQRARRMIGAWCFVDHFGPDNARPGMQIPPHPHTGLQTVTWLAAGAILHRDGLGNVQQIIPGQLNLMSAGRGLTHSEQSPQGHPPGMHGLQLWIALPEVARHDEPRFDHHTALPSATAGDALVTIVVGAYGGVRSPALVHSPLVGADIALDAGSGELSADPNFEHAVLVLSGNATVAGVELAPGALLYLAPGRTSITVTAAGHARLFLLGGEPFTEQLVMWWNFVGRSHEDIEQARDDWAAGRRFAPVAGCAAEPLVAPPMPTVRLKARDRHGTAR